MAENIRPQVEDRSCLARQLSLGRFEILQELGAKLENHRQIILHKMCFPAIYGTEFGDVKELSALFPATQPTSRPVVDCADGINAVDILW